ncbi:MAG TPA: lysophospholipid acyltransferase family protein [Chitinispirillaceae bacterium]|nr:lysophospholipid acyltransferase family protein [Chitinispirillaceae bacterium]
MNYLSRIKRQLFWQVLSRPFVHFIVRRSYKFQLTTQSEHFPKPPFIAVANHGTFFDPWLVGVYSNTPLVYMVNDDGFRGKSMSSWYLRNIGAIPKKKGASDFKAMKAALSTLNDNYPVFIFPEGQTTWDGQTQPLYKGLEKIVKKVQCPLVMIKFQGNFLARPWWAKTIRKGRILITLKTIPSEQINAMSSDEVFDTIKSYITHNDIKDPQNLTVPFTGNYLAEGLELFIWICNNCKSEDTLKMNGNTITCTHCGTSWTIDAHCRFTLTDGVTSQAAGDLWDWSQMHKREVENKINSHPTLLTKNENVTLWLENENNIFQPESTGTLELTSESLQFTTASRTRQWSISQIKEYVIQKKDIFECRDDTTTYRFTFKGNSPMKWVYYFRYLNNFQICEEQGYY